MAAAMGVLCANPRRIFIPTLQFVRHSRKPNVQRPGIPYYKKALYLELTKPMFPDPRLQLPGSDNCQKIKQLNAKVSKENPYEVLLAKLLLESVEKSQLVGICHLNSLKDQDKFKIKNLLRRDEMTLKILNSKIARMAFEGTKYETIIPLLKISYSLILCEQPRVDKFLKNMRKMPQFVLMAAVVEGRLLSKNELVAYSQLPPLPMMHAQLCTTLNAAASSLSNALTHNQQAVVNSLKQLVQKEES